MNVTLDIAAVLSAVTWPLIALIALIVCRKYIPDMVKMLSGRVKKLEFAGLSLELTEVKSFTPDWSSSSSN